MGLVFSFSAASQSKNPAFYIERYLKTGDTNQLSVALEKINADFVRYNDVQSKELLLKASARAEAESYPEIAEIYSLIRQYYISEGNRPKTLEYSLKQYKAISRKGNSEELLWILIDIGNMFYDESEYDQALDFYKKAEIIGIKQQLSNPMAVVYLNFGLVYTEKDDFQTALYYLHKSSEYRIKEKNVRMAASTFVRIARAHTELHQADSAYKYIQLAEEYYYRRGTSDEITEIPMFIDLAWFHYYELTGDHYKAIARYEKAQRYARKYNMMYDYYSNIFFESKYYSNRGEYHMALERLLGTLAFFKKNNLPDEERYVYKMVGNLYDKLNDSDNVRRYWKLYILLDDSLRQSNLKSDLDMMRTIAAVYESDARLERTKKNLHIEKMNTHLRERQRNASIWIAALAISGILVLFGLFLKLRKNRKTLLSLHRQLKSQHKEMKINSLELERTNKIKDKLFSIIAHDLRNPLNRLMAELSIAKKRHAENHFLDPMEVTLKETINLFEGLLQWSKLDNNHNIYSPTKVNLGENINKIIAFYLPEIQAKNIQVINNTGAIMAFADRNILQTLLRNILSNAITSVARESDQGMIRIETEILDDDTISILFHDSGSGFPTEIIESFSANENITNGKGLGLSICKMLAKMSGWTMEVSNGSNLGGAKIGLVLPAFRDEIAPAELIVLELTKEWKSKLQPAKGFKFYQTSEIRKFLKSFGEINDRSTSLWISQLEECVREGNELRFSELLKMLEDF